MRGIAPSSREAQRLPRFIQPLVWLPRAHMRIFISVTFCFGGKGLLEQPVRLEQCRKLKFESQNVPGFVAVFHATFIAIGSERAI